VVGKTAAPDRCPRSLRTTLDGQACARRGSANAGGSPLVSALQHATICGHLRFALTAFALCACGSNPPPLVRPSKVLAENRSADSHAELLRIAATSLLAVPSTSIELHEFIFLVTKDEIAALSNDFLTSRPEELVLGRGVRRTTSDPDSLVLAILEETGDEVHLRVARLTSTEKSVGQAWFGSRDDGWVMTREEWVHSLKLKN